MRMGRRTLENLYTSLQAYYPFAIEKVQGSGGHNGTPFLKILCAVLYKLGRVTTFRDVADLFGICKTSISDKFPIVVRMIIEVIGPVFLKWPSINRQRYIAQQFAAKRGVVGVVGCTDGSHIPVSLVDEELATDLYNRKGFYSLILQATVDCEPLFTDIYVGWPGSVHDGRVWRNSPLKRKLDEVIENNYNNQDFILRNAHLLGDAAYARTTTMIPPFKDNGRLRHKHRRFNKRHSGTRMTVERCFGMAKGRFGTLRLLNHRSLKLQCEVIVACCILHNFVMLKGVPLNEQDFLGPIPNLHDDIIGNTVGEAKRRRIMDHLMTL